jgi:hypothetical protein
MYVTLPSRAFGTGEQRRYFDFVRAESGDHKETYRVKDWIRAEYKAWKKGQGA